MRSDKEIKHLCRVVNSFSKQTIGSDPCRVNVHMMAYKNMIMRFVDSTERFDLDEIFTNKIESRDIIYKDKPVSGAFNISAASQRVKYNSNHKLGLHYAVLEDYVLVWHCDGDYTDPIIGVGTNAAINIDHENFFVKIPGLKPTSQDHENLKYSGFTRIN